MATCSGVPAAISRPPAAPPSGPRSMIQSAALTSSRLCSTTTTLLPACDQALEHAQQAGRVGQVQAGGRFVQQVQAAPGRAPAQLLGQLDALGLPARQGGGRLAELQVAQPDVGQHLQAGAGGRHVLEQRQGFFDGQVEHLGDIVAAVLDCQRLPIEAPPVADRAAHFHVRHELHLDGQHAGPLAALAAPARDVEGEVAQLSGPGGALRAWRRRFCGWG